jgi:SAM-dependent methyltransferase
MKPASFRDPEGFVFEHNKQIFRFIYKHASPHIEAILNSPAVSKFIKHNMLVSSTFLSEEKKLSLFSEHHFLNDVEASAIGAAIEHARIHFPSFPYEWAPEMLYKAGSLTLEMAEKLLKDDLGLKDATPYNILFKATKPVFVDLLSFEKRNAKNPIWLPYSQFVKNFLLPLLANKQLKMPLSQIFTTKRDGLEVDDLYQMAKGLNRIKPAFLSLVTIPTLLSKWISRSKNESAIYEQKLLKQPEQARFILNMTLNRLKKRLKSLAPSKNLDSQWGHYMTLEKSYSDQQFQNKCALVDSLIAQTKAKDVLDVGCNTGSFSIIAAKQGCRVVSIDFDPVVIGRLFQKADEQNLDILPLVIDFGRPSPGIGWQNREHSSFLDRAKGHFDLVLMLAVIHHLLVQERIPMNEIAFLLAEMTKKHLIIEYVSPEDPMFRRIARGRDSLYTHLTQDFFEKVFGRYFNILSKEACKNDLNDLSENTTAEEKNASGMPHSRSNRLSHSCTLPKQQVGDAHRTIYLMEKK